MLALERYGSGKLSRQEVLAPAIRLARAPLRLDAHLHQATKSLARVCRKHPDFRTRFAPLYKLFLDDGQPFSVGKTVDFSDLASTLEAIEAGGSEAFYRGAIGEKIVAEIQRRGGPLAREDLAAYAVRSVASLRGRFGPYEIVTMPPPSSGGAVILQILNVLSASSPHIKSSYPPTADGAHLLVEAMKHAYADRAAYLGDRSDAVLADVERMISPQRAREVRSCIDPEKTRAPGEYGLRAAGTDGGTSHFCVVDTTGWAVACTQTINTAFGSYILVEGTGIILNNEMDDFAVDTKTPNAFGLRQSARNLIKPGRRPLSSMSPTIVLRDGNAVLLLGASGGPKIISATLQTLLNVLVGGMEVNEAVAAPRLHHQWLPDEVLAQRGTDPHILESLRQRGHRLKTDVDSLGHVQAIRRRANGWRGACDPKKGGKPAGR